MSKPQSFQDAKMSINGKQVGSVNAMDLEIEKAHESSLAKIKSNRFDYVAYDERAAELQAQAKALMIDIDHFIELNLASPRAKALALTKLEETYMWIGKAIRDDQIDRNGTAELQESRGNQ